MFKHPRKYWAIVALIFIALIPSQSYTKDDIRIDGPGIASAHPIATQAGLKILEQGGNAFDAAVAVSAALSVVEPYSSGIGGGGFFLLFRSSDNFTTFIDAREVAPGMSEPDMYLDSDRNFIPRSSLVGPLASGIPGLPAALAHVAENYGNLPLKQSLQPAIKLAEEGFPVYSRLNTALNVASRSSNLSPKFKEIFLPNNGLPEIGELIKQPELANTLKIIANKGHDGFYKSDFTEKIVKETNTDGSIWSVEDFSEYEVVERQPIKISFENAEVTLAPPPSSGGTTIATILNILSQYNYQEMADSELTHLIAESMRRAYQDRAYYLGDPDFADVPVKMLTHPDHAIEHSTSIDLNRATPIHLNDDRILVSQDKGTETTHFSIVDLEGNRVATTQTINTWFGSGYMSPSGGFILNNEMDDFSAKPFTPNRYGLVHGEANSILPKKRMLSSMTPSFIESDRGIAILGTPGGSKIITMVLLSMLNWINGGTADDMTSVKRFHHQYLPDIIQHEKDAFSNSDIDKLRRIGHTLKEVRDYGNMQVSRKIKIVARKAVRKEKVKTGKVRKAKIRGGIQQAIMEYRGNIIIISNNKIK